MNERMVKCYVCFYKILVYKCGDEVLVCYRLDRRGSIIFKWCIVLKGIILKKSKINFMFKVWMVLLGLNKEIEKWLFVEDIINVGFFKREKGKKME